MNSESCLSEDPLASNVSRLTLVTLSENLGEVEGILDRLGPEFRLERKLGLATPGNGWKLEEVSSYDELVGGKNMRDDFR